MGLTGKSIFSTCKDQEIIDYNPDESRALKQGECMGFLCLAEFLFKFGNIPTAHDVGFFNTFHVDPVRIIEPLFQTIHKLHVDDGRSVNPVKKSLGESGFPLRHGFMYQHLLFVGTQDLRIISG